MKLPLIVLNRCFPGLLAAALACAAHASADGVPLLPPPATVMQVLARLPQVLAADEGVSAAQARSQRLEAGPYEWSLKGALHRRSDVTGARFSEQEVGLEKTLRWPGKLAADRQLGALGVRAGQLARGDAWHEAARGLLADWFEALRESRNAELLQGQAQLASQQLDIVQKRVKAGEAARLETLAAQADQARVAAAAGQARTRADALARTLARRYPGLPALPAHLEAGPPAMEPADLSAQDWVGRILADNHELELAEATAQQARQRADRTALDLRGDPAVGVRATRERGGQENVIGVYVAMPLGDAGRQADIGVALAEARRAEQLLAQTRLRVEAEAWRAATAAFDSRANWRQLDAAREQTQRSAELQASAYRLGETPLADVLLARRNALEATLAAEMARLNTLEAHARLLLDTLQLWAPAHE